MQIALSALFGSSVSDREIAVFSSILKLMIPGDSLMADQGLAIEDVCAKHGGCLKCWPFLCDAQLSAKDLVSGNIAHCITQDPCREGNGANQELTCVLWLQNSCLCWSTSSSDYCRRVNDRLIGAGNEEIIAPVAFFVPGWLNSTVTGQ